VPRPPQDDAPFSALVFKIMTDPFVGHGVHPRLLRHHEDGRFGPQHHEGHARAHRPPGEDARQQAEEIKEVYAGDIAAAAGLKNVTTGDTICDPTSRWCSRTSTSPPP
jgi:elongation factor G